jgi:hypothetical protein
LANTSLLPITMTPAQIQEAFNAPRFQLGLVPETPPLVK